MQYTLVLFTNIERFIIGNFIQSSEYHTGIFPLNVMSSCTSGSVRSLSDIDPGSINQALDSYDFDSASETSEAWSYQAPKPKFDLVLPSSFIQRLYNLSGFVTTQTRLQNEQTVARAPTLHPTAYLDGMRGLAAFAVFLCHLSYGTFDLTHTYLAGEADSESENKSLLQLPGIRLLYSGPPMVAIFFVISGYALSYKPLKQMRNHEYDALALTLTSSVFRRALRLFLPCFVSTFVVVCLVQLGAYEFTETFASEMRMIHEDHAYRASSVSVQLGQWMQEMLDFINVFDWSLYSGSIDLDRHLWTIPVEFRCSLALFLTHLLVARMRSGVRLATLTFLSVWGTYWNRWDMVPFWAGALLAESDLIKIGHETLTCEKSLHPEPSRDRRFTMASCTSMFVFMLGIFLASYPDADGHISPGYVQLTNMIPEQYTEKHRFWPTIGAVMIVWSVGNLRFLKKSVFESYVMQFLGKISFPLYVCHGFIIHTFGYVVMDWVWASTGGYDNWCRFQVGFAFSAACTIGVTVWISHIFLRVVDVRCVKFARWFEGQLFVHH